MSPSLLLAQAAESGFKLSLEMPPLHPILVNFTAALVPASFISDLLGRLLRKQSLTSAGWWTLFYASLITPLTALAGWLWLRRMGGMDMPEMSIHKWLGTAIAIVFFALLFWRWRIHRADGTPSWLYLICTALVVGVLTLQGHLGGSISFGNESTEVRNSSQSNAGMSSMDHATDQHLQWRDHIELKDKQ